MADREVQEEMDCQESSVWDAAAEAYAELGPTLRVVRHYAVISFVLLLAVDYAISQGVEALATGGGNNGDGAIFLSLISLAGYGIPAVFFAPLAIAIHRHILLGVRPEVNYLAAFRDNRVVRFGVACFILDFLFGYLPEELMGILKPLFDDLSFSFVQLVIYAVAITLLCRLSLILPAIAIDSPGRKFSHA